MQPNQYQYRVNFNAGSKISSGCLIIIERQGEGERLQIESQTNRKMKNACPNDSYYIIIIIQVLAFWTRY